MRSTIYAENTGTDDECSVAVEVMWQPNIIRQALMDGRLTVQQIAETLGKGVKAVSIILEEYERRNPKGVSGA